MQLDRGITERCGELFNVSRDDERCDLFERDAVSFAPLAENLPDSARKPLQRPSKSARKAKQTRAKRPNYKEQFVIAKEYKNKRLEKEFVAEFDSQPTACDRKYRMAVLKKQVSVSRGQLKLFDESPYFLYITNLPKKKEDSPATGHREAVQ